MYTKDGQTISGKKIVVDGRVILNPTACRCWVERGTTLSNNEAFAIADNYKAQCLAYLNTSETCCKRKLVNNRLSIKKIGH